MSMPPPAKLTLRGVLEIIIGISAHNARLPNNRCRSCVQHRLAASEKLLNRDAGSLEDGYEVLPMRTPVLSGGYGTRLHPLTHTGPKQLIPIANKLNIMYCIEDLRDIEATDIGIRL
jgi:hypothetical protein